MLAISHAATALLVKRCFPQAPMAWVLASVELPGVLWLLLPDSHSIASLLALAGVLWLAVGRLLRRRALGAALFWGIVLHLALDVAFHPQELSLAPLSDLHVGLGLSATPPLAIAAAVAYGLLCWLVFGGGRPLLAALFLLTVAQFSFAAAPVLHITAATAAVWYFSRARAAELEHPDRRLARAFA